MYVLMCSLGAMDECIPELPSPKVYFSVFLSCVFYFGSLFLSLPAVIYHPVCLHCTFSQSGSVYLSLQVVPQFLISLDALLELLPEELHCCQFQLESMETLGTAKHTHILKVFIHP